MNQTEPKLELVEISTEIEPSLPVVKWTDGRDHSWWTGSPLAEFRAQEGDLSAQAWMAVSTDAILFRVVVRKATHSNHRTGYNIYDGDSVQIAIDARGDGACGMQRETRYIGQDDGYFGFALTRTGTEVWAYYLRENRGVAHAGCAMPKEYANIVRNDEAGTTTYDIAIPWKELDTPAGFSPVMGVCVQVNTGEHRDRRFWMWGDTGSGHPQPAKMKRVHLAPPDGPRNLAASGKTDVWTEDDFGEILISRWSAGACRMRAKLGAFERTFDLPAIDQGVNRRYAIRGLPGRATGESVELSVEWQDSGLKPAVLQKATLKFPGSVLLGLHERVSHLLTRANHPLVRGSLESIRAAADWEWARSLADIRDGRGTPWAVDTCNWIQELLKNMPEDLADWSSYRQGKYPLVMAFRASEQGALRLYKAKLPRDYDPTRAYPAVYFLHGAGLVHMLQHVASDISPLEKNLYLNNPAAGETPFFEFRLFVGRQGYWLEGEVATWDQIEHLERTFLTDPDRRSLTGGSMGGMGAWSLGLRTPDRWASLCVMMARAHGNQVGTRRPDDFKVGLGRNAAGLPVRFDHGAEDLLVPVQCTYDMRAELARWGIEPELHVYEGANHGLPQGAYDQTVQWMLQHRRKRPDKFAFVADTDRYRGIWGVVMRRDAKTDPLPSFECEIVGQTVRLTSQGTSAIEVNAGEGGLGLSGDVTVVWNGKEVYRGPVRTVVCQ